MKQYTLAAALLLLLLIGCKPGKQWHKESFEDIYPKAGTESFTAIFSLDTFINHGRLIKGIIVEIDSSGFVRKFPGNNIPLDTFSFKRINNITLLYDSYRDRTINYFNPYSGTRKVVLQGFRTITLSNNRKFVATQDRNDALPENRVYSLTDTGIVYVSKSSIYNIFYPFGEDKFLAILRWDLRPKSNSYTYILNSDLTVFDSVSEDVNIGTMSGLNSSTDSNSVIFPTWPHWSTNTEIVSFSFNSHTIDTLFKWMYFSKVIRLSDGYFLLQGRTKSEYDEESKRDNSMCLKREEIPQGGYWMVGISRSKKIKKIGFEDFRSTLSSGGRHVLLYKQIDEPGGIVSNYQMKVVSVKDLIEGM